MSELCFLGTGGSVATKERDNTSFLIRASSTLVLVDCPGSVIQKIKKLSFSPLEVKHLIISHVHPDHVYGLPSLIHSLMLESLFISLYGSEETVSFCRRLLNLFNLLEREIKVKINFIPLKPDEKIVLDDSLEIKAFETPHSSSSLAFHFFMKDEGKELVYSGDTPAKSLLFHEAHEVDYLIHDCSAPSRFFDQYPSLSVMHTSALDLGRFAQEAGVKCLIPCHFFGELEYSVSEIEEEIRKNYKNRLIIPRDFGKIPL